MRHLFYWFFLLNLFILTGCKKGVIGSEGRIISVERSVGPFTQVLLYDNINLIFTQDTVTKIRIEAPEKITPYIKTELIGHSLTIRNANAGLLIPPGERINVYLSVTDLQRLDYFGAGDISCTNAIQTNYFTVIAAGANGNVYLNLHTIQTLVYLYGEAADFIFSGQSDSCYTYCSSVGTIDYRSFNVKKMGIDYSALRDAYIFVSESLKGNINYKGNVFYKGSPSTVQVQTLNEGRLIHY